MSFHSLLVFCAETLSRHEFPFPPDFVFRSGTTTAYQSEGAAFQDGRTASIWDTFAHAGLFLEDVQLMVETGLEAYRRDFTAYAEVCFREFGDRVLYWTTVNEANIFVVGGYDIGIIPPQRCSSPFGMKCAVGNSSTEPYIAAHHILLAHSLAARLYKKKYQGKQQGFIGINVYAYWPLPYTNTTEDVIAAQRTKDFLIGWFMGPLVFGDYPDIMKKNVGTRLPAFTKIESEQVKGSFDFIGVNHYTTIYTRDKSSSLKMDTRDFNADMAVKLICQRTWKNATLSDPGRVKYIQSFIGSLLDAMRNGSNARGYFYWSFMDLFELLDGYESCYGLYYVDLNDKDLKRYPKLSAHWYSNFLKGQSMNLNGATEVQKMIDSTLSQSHSSQ
ncbi:hypothetical protein TEA_024861 [Camellia sinensis var. sinensis]|uniref:Uncharacterized protein n=1 Tax=Camellia sinensis var. sinensis TaxID=542762 RepID=A0A4S4E4K4_CAMSN|nr:hypothetical protein TEA_024861 [Camellia sinensis var. sinensis]